MINQVAAEARNSATYVGNYLDCVENLPDDAQRQLSRIRDIDVQYRSILRDIDLHYEQYRALCGQLTDNSAKRLKSMARVQQCLIAAQELGDEKMHIVNQLVEIIENNSRQLDHDFKSLDFAKEQQHHDIPSKVQRLSSPPLLSLAAVSIKMESQSYNTLSQNPQVGAPASNSLTGNERSSIDITKNNTTSTETRTNKRSRRPRNDNNTVIESGNNESNSANEANISQKQNSSQSNTGTSQKKTTAQAGGKKKKRKARGQGNNQVNAREDTPPPDPIDPDEPTYCLCDQISFGEMILCDNDLCPIEWFHFSCVALITKPKGKWYCPNCRGDRPNIMKPKAQFLKELERYNKEREEKN